METCAEIERAETRKASARRPGGPPTRAARRAAGALAALLALCAAGPARAQATEPGRDAYVQYCASCHGRDAKGAGPVAESLKRPPTDLTKLAQRYGAPLPRAQLLRFIDGRDMVRAHGSEEMPVWGRKLLASVPPGAGTEFYKRGILHTILDWLETVQVADPIE